MAGTTIFSHIPDSAPPPAETRFENLIELKCLAPGGIGLTLLPAEISDANDRRLSELLINFRRDVDRHPEFSRLVLDCSRINFITDLARGAFVDLFKAFAQREGTLVVGATEGTLRPFSLAKVSDLYRLAPNFRAGQPDLSEQADFADLVNDLHAELFQHDMRSARAPLAVSRPEPGFNGNLIFYRICEGTAIVSLNPEITTVDEDSKLARAFAEAAQSIAVAEPNCHRILFNLQGVEHIGADTLGTFIALHQRAKAGRGDTIALCHLEKNVAEKIKLSRLDRIIPVFPTAVEGLDATW
jgi:anti-anti-sigma factor